MDWKKPEKGIPFTAEYLKEEIVKFREIANNKDAWNDPKKIAMALRALIYVWINLDHSDVLLDAEMDNICTEFEKKLNSTNKT